MCTSKTFFFFSNISTIFSIFFPAIRILSIFHDFGENVKIKHAPWKTHCCGSALDLCYIFVCLWECFLFVLYFCLSVGTLLIPVIFSSVCRNTCDLYYIFVCLWEHFLFVLYCLSVGMLFSCITFIKSVGTLFICIIFWSVCGNSFCLYYILVCLWERFWFVLYCLSVGTLFVCITF